MINDGEGRNFVMSCTCVCRQERRYPRGIYIVLGEMAYKTWPILVDAIPTNNPGIIAIAR